MESSSPIRSKKPVLESNTINAVPESARHGAPSSQFTLWLSANLQITAVVDGALAIIFGSEAMSAIIGLLIGNIIGGAVMALHSSQGAKLGLPQMISSRIRFGVKGAALPLLMVIIMYLGFAATGTVLSGQAINRIFGFESASTGIIIFGMLTAMIALVGYKLIHVVGRVAGILSILGFIYLATQLSGHYDVAAAFGQKPFSLSVFLLTIALSAGWQLTFAPYASDYSRYLPSDTPAKSIFFATFLGTTLGAQCAMTFGVLVAACGANFLKDQVGFMGELAGPTFAILIYMVIVCGKLTVNCLNAYGGFMSILATVSSFNDRSQVSQRVRAAYVVGFVLLSMVVALAASADFLNNFKNFVLLLLTVFVPWSAINLIDYYFISQGKTDIPALYTPEGRYGAYNKTALTCYGVGVLVQIPFLNQKLYQGPISVLMDGADISWIVGLLITAVIYYPWAKRTTCVPAYTIYPES
ncbi:cytosine permease [Escherichia coli]|nr:cytosine permease [Escherichia coli]EGO9648617.1 cytosine permease [Escherichia coli]EGP5927841.1 cytosine permease [Escherichia coli]EHL1363983.1 cytosine permease [Escherichia coli]EJO9643758.1 cytosine permease [Escherichia coli]